MAQNETRALQAAEKLAAEGGGGFIPRIKPIKSTSALQAAEKLNFVRFCNKGTALAGPQTADNKGWALAPEGASSDTLQVLGADTTVTLDDLILGKPESPADAARILRLLSGRTHRVITGVAVVTAHSIQSAAEVTTVTFLPLTEAEISAYVATGEPMDKAGAYAIQGQAARWIPRIEGCYFNVVGLPLALVSTLLAACQPLG
jgi:septum formation protein